MPADFVVPTEIDFDDLKRIEIPVKLEGKRYILREATAEGARQFRNLATAAYRLTDGKLSGLQGSGDVEILLISLCLFEVYSEVVNGIAVDKFRPVIALQIKNFPSRVTKYLFDTAKEISELGEKDTVDSLEKQIKALQEKLDGLKEGTLQDSAKNGQSGTQENAESQAISA